MTVPEEEWDMGDFALALGVTIQEACSADTPIRYGGELLYTWAVVNAVLRSPEMQEIKAALRMCWETFDWFQYDWAPQKLSDHVIEWIKS